MRKIVINTCYGGFGLSKKAFEAIAERKNWSVICAREGYYWFLPYVTEFTSFHDLTEKEKHDLIGDMEIPRDDPDLVAVVEQLGEDANAELANLRIVEIPEQVSWSIEEYDGNEHIAEAHRTWR